MSNNDRLHDAIALAGAAFTLLFVTRYAGALLALAVIVTFVLVYIMGFRHGEDHRPNHKRRDP